MSDEWSEHNDRDIVDWKRVRSEIEHEDNLTNHRLTWLLTSEGFLFASFALVFQASTKTDVNINAALSPFYKYILSGIAVAGILSSFFIWLYLRGADAQLRKLEKWWNDRITEEKLKKHPPIRGHATNLLMKWFPCSTMPFVFILAWVLFICVVLEDQIKEHADMVGGGASYINCCVWYFHYRLHAWSSCAKQY